MIYLGRHCRLILVMDLFTSHSLMKNIEDRNLAKILRLEAIYVRTLSGSENIF